MKDTKLQKLIALEIKRQEESINLIASENFASREILDILGSPLTNKYSEGYPGKRYYPGNAYYDEIELLAQDRGLASFKLDPKEWRLNVQPHSGSPANLAIYTGLLEPGDTIMGMKLAAGGHLTHGHKVSATGRFWKSVQYGVLETTGLVDFEEVQKLANESKPKIIVSGFTAYPRAVDFKKFGEIAKSVGAYHMADISHIAGLIVAGVHPTPFPYADVVMTTTHKSLRGPRGAVIFSRIEISDRIDRGVFPGLQGGPHNNVTAAIAHMFYEAGDPSFKKYGKQIVKNARALAKALSELGFSLVSGGTDTHLILADVRSLGVLGLEAQNRLESVGIIANRNSVPGDPSPFKPSGIRLGTPAVTSRGMKEKEMVLIAKLIEGAIRREKGVSSEVLKLCRRFPAKKFLKK
ncbi:MAG: serine hydroxymethyltransferase [Candidatus Colwellbacteria bacterium RIFCSPHIGHO2_12_FULL_43_12]|uniref:Serine hydroxymethyltransferase n=1 Tax=Candidatus Colwellbacteria bacterium RIFCSPHIGHO2_12_FULL_43_12 TaxID=1797688 RepID=A0A1G1Z1S0_9BACT|nr:MAG: serine hydroxymethyltransferase [Candidatus Colwellbacteria bacterium RIFCSPHIGHO2_12_FULL_43_12]